MRTIATRKSEKLVNFGMLLMDKTDGVIFDNHTICAEAHAYTMISIISKNTRDGETVICTVQDIPDAAVDLSDDGPDYDWAESNMEFLPEAQEMWVILTVEGLHYNGLLFTYASHADAFQAASKQSGWYDIVRIF